MNRHLVYSVWTPFSNLVIHNGDCYRFDRLRPSQIIAICYRVDESATKKNQLKSLKLTYRRKSDKSKL